MNAVYEEITCPYTKLQFEELHREISTVQENVQQLNDAFAELETWLAGLQESFTHVVREVRLR